MSDLDVILVMPVYNEQDCIVAVLQNWERILDGLGIRYHIRVYNDGSTDDTLRVLQQFENSCTVKVIDKPNSGHGPTILRGYKEATPLAEWVFQCDSDGEMMPEGFPTLWVNRNEYDALFGYRENRVQSRGRAFISAVSRFAVRRLFGPGVLDVNTPYRLMRGSILARIVASIPNDTFAPNVLISGDLCRWKCRIFNTPVPHVHRRTGRVSIVKWKLWKAAVRSFFQMLHHACKNPGQ